jgi:hypothetical protein
VIYAIALIVVAVTSAGNTWGLGRSWAALPFVQRRQWPADRFDRRVPAVETLGSTLDEQKGSHHEPDRGPQSA